MKKLFYRYCDFCGKRISERENYLHVWFIDEVRLELEEIETVEE